MIVDWWAPPFGRQRDAGRRADDDEPRAGVEAVDQRIEAAADERVVHRADRQQVLAVEVVSEPERVQQQEQVHLADAELDVLAGRRLLPPQQPVLAEEVDAPRSARTRRAC